MTSSKIRQKLLIKISQPSLTMPTEKAVSETLNIGVPTSFAASDRYPTLRKAFDSNAINVINDLSTYINSALFYASGGTYSLSKLYTINFNFSTTDIPPVNKDLKNLLLFSKELYVQIYNSGNQYINKLSEDEFNFKINTLLRSQNLNNLSQTNPSGPLSIKMGGDVKVDIISYLRLLLNIAPST